MNLSFIIEKTLSAIFIYLFGISVFRLIVNEFLSLRFILHMCMYVCIYVYVYSAQSQLLNLR